MLPGFNTNVRHRGVLFHVQSEDSGRAHPHVITHLYHGGTIIASERSRYAEHVQDPDLPATVRRLMERQHKEVLGRLRRREFDALILERLGGDAFAGEADAPADPKADSKADTAPADRAEGTATVETTRTSPPPARPFGEGIVSEKPLDEVILNYLVENARKRKQRRS